MKILAAAAVALVALGCIDREEEYTLNPDGSGKVVITWVAAPFDPYGSRDKDPDDIVKKIVRTTLEDLKGVDCWKDVAYSVRPDGKITFRGTAYFKSLNDLHLGESERGSLSTKLTLDKDDKGNVVVTQVQDAGGDEAGASKSKPGEDEVKKLMTTHRLRYQQARPALRAALTDYRLRLKLNLPGEIDEVRGFAKSDRAARHEVEGAALFKMLDDLYLSDDALRKAVQEGADISIEERQLPGYVRDSIYGAKGLRVSTKGPVKPAFDYAAEVTDKDREEYKKLLDSLPKRARFGMDDDEAKPDAKSLEEVLKEHIVIDLGADPALSSTRPIDEYHDQISGPRGPGAGSLSYDISGPSFSMSGGGGEERFVRLRFGQGNSVEKLEYRVGPESVAVRQAAGLLRITLENDATGMSAMLYRNSRGVQLVVMGGTENFSRRWSTMDEAARTNPAEFGPVLACLRTAPLRMAPTAADPDVVALALRWTEKLDEGTRGKLDALRQRLLDDSLVERDRATADLKTEAGSDVLRIRHLVEALETTKDPDSRLRMQSVIDGQPGLVADIGLVRAKELHRDLPYLGALLADAGRAAAVKARLAALTGRDFASRQEFDAWHAANREKLAWDPARGRYALKP